MDLSTQINSVPRLPAHLVDMFHSVTVCSTYTNSSLGIWCVQPHSEVKYQKPCLSS